MRNLTDSAKDKNYWRVLVNAALNFRNTYAIESFVGNKMKCPEI